MKNGVLIILILLCCIAVKANAGGADTAASTKQEFNCSKYGPDSVKAIQYYSLYREYFKQENYEEAIKYWPYVYENAPTLHKNVIKNGIEYYQHLIEKEKDEAVKKSHINMLMSLYDHRIACFGEEGDNLAKKGYDLLKYAGSANDLVGEIFGKAIEKGGNEAPYHILSPYFSIIINQLNSKMVTAEEALAIKSRLIAICDANSDSGKYAVKYVSAKAKIEKTFEKVGDNLFDCQAMKASWKKAYDADPENVDNIKDFLGKMNKCENDPFYAELEGQLFVLAPTSAMYMQKASGFLKEKDYENTALMIEEAIALETDLQSIGEWNYKLAELEYAMKDFPAARSFAYKAAEAIPGWGKPYVLIGKLYASSGKLCGPGTGFESQRVVWAAIDKFSKAKSIDGSVAEEAQELINKYWAYLPEKEELFMMGYAEGSSYFVPCWIQESTIVRAKSN